MPNPISIAIPANSSFGVNAFANGAFTQQLTVTVPGKNPFVKAGSGTNAPYANTVLETGGSTSPVNVSFAVTGNGKASQMQCATTQMNGVNFSVITTEDGGGTDWNDSVVVVYWPVG